MEETGVLQAPAAPLDPPAESIWKYRLKPPPNASAAGPRKGLKQRRFSGRSGLGGEKLFRRQVGADFDANPLDRLGEDLVADDQRFGAVH